MKSSDVVLVCVTPQLSCKNQIIAGKALADQANASLRILCVFPKMQCFNPNIDALETLSETANEIGAEMTVSFNDSPVESAIRFAKGFNVSTVVTGFPGEHSSDFVTKFHRAMPHMPLCMVDSDGTAYNITTPAQERARFIAAKAEDFSSFKYSSVKI